MALGAEQHLSVEVTAWQLFRQKAREQIVRRRVAASLVIFTSLILLDIFVFRALPRNVFDLTDPMVLSGYVTLALGIATRSWAAGVLHKHQALSVDGPYSLVRNPLYFGSFLMMAGFGLLIDDWWTPLIILGPIGFIYVFQIAHEERDLGGQYGDAWRQYQASTPRFIPRLALPTKSNWAYSQWLHNREWQAVLASVVAVGAMRLWLSLAA